MNELASGSKRNYCRAVKRVLRWAVQQGYIDFNPIAHLEQPKPGNREVVLSQAEFDRLVALAPSCEFRDLLIVTWETGCRPQESLRVEARHVDLKSMRWVFPEKEGKGEMGRVVYLTDKAAEIMRRLAMRSAACGMVKSQDGGWWSLGGCMHHL
ncbi:MAG: tyrosine-type recombinase/integrase [Planctomycetaceae bacterium]